MKTGKKKKLFNDDEENWKCRWLINGTMDSVVKWQTIWSVEWQIILDILRTVILSIIEQFLNIFFNGFHCYWISEGSQFQVSAPHPEINFCRDGHFTFQVFVVTRKRKAKNTRFIILIFTRPTCPSETGKSLRYLTSPRSNTHSILRLSWRCESQNIFSLLRLFWVYLPIIYILLESSGQNFDFSI